MKNSNYNNTQREREREREREQIKHRNKAFNSWFSQLPFWNDALVDRLRTPKHTLPQII